MIRQPREPHPQAGFASGNAEPSAAVAFDLPYPPSANRLWRSHNGRNIKSREYRNWLGLALEAVSRADPTPVAGPYKMTIIANRPDRRVRDLSNLLKAAEDAVVIAGVVEDDSMAREIGLAWSDLPPAKPGSLRVFVESVR